MSYLIGFSKGNHIFLSYSGWLSVASIDSIPLWSWVIIVPEISHLNGLCGKKHCCFCIADDYVKRISHCNIYIILDKCDTYRLCFCKIDKNKITKTADKRFFEVCLFLWQYPIPIKYQISQSQTDTYSSVLQVMINFFFM